MAIKFVDIEPEGAGNGKPKWAKQVDALVTEPAAERPGVSPLPYAKPEPKPMGRKKPLR